MNGYLNKFHELTNKYQQSFNFLIACKVVPRNSPFETCGLHIIFWGFSRISLNTKHYRKHTFFNGGYCSFKQHKVPCCSISAIKDFRHYIWQMNFKINMMHCLLFKLLYFFVLLMFFLWGLHTSMYLCMFGMKLHLWYMP